MTVSMFRNLVNTLNAIDTDKQIVSGRTASVNESVQHGNSEYALHKVHPSGSQTFTTFANAETISYHDLKKYEQELKADKELPLHERHYKMNESELNLQIEYIGHVLKRMDAGGMLVDRERLESIITNKDEMDLTDYEYVDTMSDEEIYAEIAKYAEYREVNIDGKTFYII